MEFDSRSLSSNQLLGLKGAEEERSWRLGGTWEVSMKTRRSLSCPPRRVLVLRAALDI